MSCHRNFKDAFKKRLNTTHLRRNRLTTLQEVKAAHQYHSNSNCTRILKMHVHMRKRVILLSWLKVMSVVHVLLYCSVIRQSKLPGINENELLLKIELNISGPLLGVCHLS